MCKGDLRRRKKRGRDSAHGKNIQSEKRKMIKVKIKTEMGGTERLGFLLGRGEIEEAQGRGDLATIHHPTLLAAEAQTVCSQQYMHLLVLFQEIITVCVIVCVLCVPGCQFSAKSGQQVVMRWQINNMEWQYNMYVEISVCLWVCQANKWRGLCRCACFSQLFIWAT